MFKSCDYCRHRKKKCVVPPASTRCTDCEHLDLRCEFSARHPSLKRRQTSKQIAARIGSNGSKSHPNTAYNDNGVDIVADEANLKEGDCQIRLAGRADMANKRLFLPISYTEGPHHPHSDSLSTSELYWRHVYPFWPFIPTEVLEEGDLGGEAGLKGGIELVYHLSLTGLRGVEDALLHSEKFVATLQRDHLSLSTITCALLLCSFIRLEDDVIQRVFDTISHGLASALIPIPPPLMSAALLTNVWRRLSGHSHPPLHLSPDILQGFAQGLDPSTFGHHYLRLTRHAAELDQRCIAMEVEGIQPDTRLVWAKLEYDCLLWQVCLPPSLLDTRDDLPATPESVIVHSMSSMLLLSLYSYVLERVDTLGTLIALRPVPGVLLFLCALARSTFICPPQLLDRMSLLVSIQAQTARIMLRLWHQTGFENCRAILNLWENPHNRFPELARQVRREIGSGPWAIEEIDGYSVFWTFRDLRTLTTKFIFAGRP